MIAVLQGWGFLASSPAAILRTKLIVSGSFLPAPASEGVSWKPCDEEIEHVQAAGVRRLRHTHQHDANKCEGVSKLAFLAVDADLDVRYGSRDGAACAEFSWEGFDDGSAGHVKD